jgi:hypothetical protein
MHGGLIHIDLDNFKKWWEAYNGFAIISIILGVVCFFLPWFRRSVYILSEFSHHDYKYFLELFYWDLKTSLFGLLYLLGFIILILYYTGVILSNHGDFDTPMEKHSKLFFKLSVVILIAFEILLYFHFINPPYSSSGWFNFFWTVVWEYDWRIYIGYILGAIMIGMVIFSFIYDRMMLRRHYREHLPDYKPMNQIESDELEDLIFKER